MDQSPKQSLFTVGLYEYQKIDHSPYLLGRGHYGKVYKGQSTVNPEEYVAIKICPVKDNWKILKRELNILYALNQAPHPNIIRAIDYREPPSYCPGEFIFVFEYVPGKTLADFLQIQPKKIFCNVERRFLREDTARAFMIQLASALEHLHRHGIFHRDLKPDNILLTEQSCDAIIKICDFGFSKFITSENELNVSGVVYVAPEILRTADNLLRENVKNDKTIAPLVYTSKSDLYSVGTIFYEMVFGEKFTKDCYTTQEIYMKTKARNIVFLPPNEHNNLSEDGRNLMIGLLQNTPEKRISWKEFFDHVYLQPQNLTRSTISQVKSQKSLSLNKKIERIPSELTFLQRVDFIGTGQIVFQIAPSQSVLSVKHILEKSAGIFVHKQLLVTIDGVILEDRCLVLDYSLDKKSQVLYLLSQDFFVPTSLNSSVQKLATMKFSIDKMKDSSVKRNKISNLNFKDLTVRSFFETIFEKERSMKSQYKRIMAAFKNSKFFSSQIQIFCNSYQALWKNAENQCELISEKIKMNDLYISQKDFVNQILSQKDSVASQLSKMLVPSALGGGNLLSKLTTVFDYQPKFKQLAELSQKLAQFYDERPTLQEVKDGITNLGPEALLSWVKTNFSIFEEINKEKRILNSHYQEYASLIEDISQYIDVAQNWNSSQLSNEQKLLSLSASLTVKIENIQKSLGIVEKENLKIKKIQEDRFNLLASTFLEKILNLQSSSFEKIENLSLRTVEYDKLTVEFQLLFRECVYFFDIPNVYPKWLKEMARRNDYNKAIISVNNLLKNECDIENKMREKFKSDHNFEQNPVLDKIHLDLSPISLQIAQFSNDSSLPPIQKRDIQNYFAPQQSGKEVIITKESLDKIKEILATQTKALEELNQSLDKLIELNKKKKEIDSFNQKEAETKKLEKDLDVIQRKRQDLEITHYEITHRKAKLDETLKEFRLVPREKFSQLRDLLNQLEGEMSLNRLVCIRTIQENKRALYSNDGTFNMQLFFELYFQKESQ